MTEAASAVVVASPSQPLSSSSQPYSSSLPGPSIQPVASSTPARRSKPRRVIYKSTNLERAAPELVAFASPETVSAVRAIQAANATAERVRDNYRSKREGFATNVGDTILGSDEESNAKKYERRLKMNRQSAAASRVRREAYTKALEAELVNMEASYKKLYSTLAEERRIREDLESDSTAGNNIIGDQIVEPSAKSSTTSQPAQSVMAVPTPPAPSEPSAMAKPEGLEVGATTEGMTPISSTPMTVPMAEGDMVMEAGLDSSMPDRTEAVRLDAGNELTSTAIASGTATNWVDPSPTSVVMNGEANGMGSTTTAAGPTVMARSQTQDEVIGVGADPLGNFVDAATMDATTMGSLPDINTELMQSLLLPSDLPLPECFLAPESTPDIPPLSGGLGSDLNDYLPF